MRRNRLRRLIKEAFRLDKASLPAGYDIVASPARGLTEPTLEAVRASLRTLVDKAVQRLERARPQPRP